MNDFFYENLKLNHLLHPMKDYFWRSLKLSLHFLLRLFGEKFVVKRFQSNQMKDY